MKWSVVIPTWHRTDLLTTLLLALCRQTFTDFEVVVVCDGADEEYTALGNSFVAPIRIQWLAHASNHGLAAARNTGAASATGVFLLFLDDDVVPDANLLLRHDTQQAAGAHAKLAVFGRTLERRQVPFRSHTDRRMQESWETHLAQAFPVQGAPDMQCVGEEAERSVFFGLNCSIARESFLKEGGFDEQLRSDEETEFGCRLYRRGYLFAYAADATVEHLNSKDMARYYPACWSRSGLNDLYRARDRGQRCAQNAQLAALRHGTFLERWVASMVWLSPQSLLRVASIAQAVTDATDSRLSFAVWARARRLGEYWTAVQGSGVTRDELRTLAGPAARLLMFHSLSAPRSKEEASYYLSGTRFRRVLKMAASLGYVRAHPNDLLAGELPRKSVVLTFDDAYDDLYPELVPMMQRDRIAPLLFVVAGRIGADNDWDQRQGLRARRLLTLDQLREMHQLGAVIGSHSMTHASLPSLSGGALRREVRDSKNRLEDLFGGEVAWFAYPFGDVDRRVRAAVAEAGYKGAVTTAPGLNWWQDPLALRRIDIHSSDAGWDVVGKLVTGRDVRSGIRNQLKRQWASLSSRPRSA